MDRLSAMKLAAEISKTDVKPGGIKIDTFVSKSIKMKQEYSIQKVNGESKTVYQVIAPIVMSKEGMKYFDNYPVTTSKEHTFYILTYDGNLCGFATIIPHKTVYSIRNIYVNNERNANISFNNLMKGILEDFEASDFDEASVYVKNEDIPLYKEKGFKVTKEGKNWSAMHKTKKP